MVVLLLACAAPADAARACWLRVLDDWTDNARIDSTYTPHCYRQALDHMSEDMKNYSSAPDDIQEALERTIQANDDRPFDGPGSDGTGGGTTPGDSGTGTPSETTTDTEPQDSDGSAAALPPDGGDGSRGPLESAFDRLGPASADAFPLPLVILGALALMLLLSGSGALLLRRIRVRRSR